MNNIEQHKKILAIDLGSNTIRMVVYDCINRSFEWEFERIVKTADRLNATMSISDEAIKRITQAINDAKKQVDFGSFEVCAYTTQALRVANNADEVIRRISHQTGVKFEIIDATIEATLTLKALQNRLDILGVGSDDMVCIDIGGGSSEVVFVDGGSVVSKSFDIGIVTVAQSFSGIDEIKSALDTKMQTVLNWVNQYYQNNRKPSTFVATAGTPTTIAAMKVGLDYESYDASKINGVVLDVKELQIQLSKLLSLDIATRQKLVGVGRDDLIIAGILIYQKFFEILGFDECIVIDDGLREGIALSGCG
jgi:exopolyphosphatase/guanosine-5'-triphosphate,3'-diphosphate pyrophosphatase